MKKLRASLLPSVIFVSILILILILLLLIYRIMYFDIAVDYYKGTQNKFDIQSGHLLQSTDSLFYVHLDFNNKYNLYNRDSLSGIYVRETDWGLYKIVKVLSHDKTQSETWMYGRKYASKYDACLWVNNNQRNIALSGKTSISGNIYLGKSINYSTIKGETFCGKKVSIEQIKKSESNLPILLEGNSNLYTYIRNYKNSRELPEFCNLVNSFNDSTIILHCSRDIMNYVMAKGNFIITGDSVTIRSTCTLEDLIIIANSIIIESGFKGNIQVYAINSVHVKKKAQLEYPSGIYIENSSSKRPIIQIEDSCLVSGYIVMNIQVEKKIPNMANYIQSTKANVNGLLYINGIAQIQGNVSGAAYLKDTYFYSSQGYYSDIVYNLQIKKDTIIGYPFLLEGPYKRLKIKCLK